MRQVRSARVSAWIGEISGSIADFGTFLPLVIGILAIGRYDATGVLVGFGLFAISVAAFYRRPMPIQPMKAVAALIIVGAISPMGAAASGLVIGGVLLVLAFSGIIGRIARLVPVSVIAGIQLGVGAQLAILGLEHVSATPAFGIGALLLLATLYFTPYRNLSSITVFALAAVISLYLIPGQLSGVGIGLHLPAFALPDTTDYQAAILSTVLPQLVLTLSNAVLATAAIAGDYFPEDRECITPTRLAASTGALNLVLMPFGAVPMCHGSGGLVAQYGFGARTWLAPAIFGSLCLVLGVGFGADAKQILSVIPLGAVGAMLAVAGAELALGRRVFDAKPSCRLVIVLTGVACVATDIASGLVVGLVLETLRSAWFRRHEERAN